MEWCEDYLHIATVAATSFATVRDSYDTALQPFQH